MIVLDNDTWFLLLTCHFTDQALLHGRVLVVFIVKYFNLLCENVFFFLLLCILLSASLACSQKANFHVYPILSMDNKVSKVSSLSYGSIPSIPTIFSKYRHFCRRDSLSMCFFPSSRSNPLRTFYMSRVTAVKGN